MKRLGYWGAMAALALLVAACGIQNEPELEALKRNEQGNLRINVLLNSDATDEILAELATFGTIHDVIYSIDAVSMMASAGQLDDIQRLPFVDAANPDAERSGIPIDTVSAGDFVDGLSTWNLDAVDVTDLGFANRTTEFDGTGVYVAVLDTGLMDSWRQYFPDERIAEEYAKSFGGGGGEQGSVSEQPNKWEHDVNGHGTHVTSSILGYSLGGTPINGVAPMATVIPVKVLNQNGSGWSSVVAAGISYIAELKAGPLADHPVVINMSLGGGVLDAVEKAALDYAIETGVIVVASAGNEDVKGMGYPAAYAPVISVAASGWVGQWLDGSWWNAGDVAEPTTSDDFYIADFSSRALPGQELDVTAPGSWVVGPYQLDQGNLAYYYLSGTSMASPHVAGIAALMLQQDPSLVQGDVESILKGTAIPFAYGADGEAICRGIFDPTYGPIESCWGPDASGSGIVTASAALAGLSQAGEDSGPAGTGRGQGKGGKKN